MLEFIMQKKENSKIRSEILGPKRIVVKIGSNVISDKNGQIDLSKIEQISEDIFWCISQGLEVILISSGAINAGRFKFAHVNNEIDFLQAASSVGQPILIQHYANCFKKYGIEIAQILLTHEDFKNRNRFLNAKNTLLKLLENKFLPILNENDAVSFEEITVGDNDHLAAMTAQMLGADLLVILTSTDGLFNKDPSEEGAYKISKVKFEEQLLIETVSKSSSGRGGMKSKLMAIEKVTPIGIHAIVAGKDFINPLKRALSESCGTFFEANQNVKTNHKKAWLLTTAKPGCHIEVDKGAYQAILKNSSLLPKGILNIHGSFSRGDCVAIICEGEHFALGLVEYNAIEVQKIAGKHSREISNYLKIKISDVVIHKDNLLIKKVSK